MFVHSIREDSNRWWWTSAGAGTIASAFIAAIVVAPSGTHAIPADPAPAPVHVSDVAPSIDVTGTRPCFMERAHWNIAVDGPVPRCGTASASSSPTEARRPAPAVKSACPPRGSITDVGVPWIPPVPTGCDSIDRWWRYAR
ncbi:hypothetical protein [Nocardioides gansuensis]|uniref:hypothetical protein n=1 Tax=Nocardioides gansuensis TaxID=2138300 RepID=UPI001403944C|nr:hypothetical protein [Nocardioides gansuensis]